MMAIKEVYFERCFNLGNYETFRIGLTATVGATEKTEDVVEVLDKFTVTPRNKKMKERD
jgi:hypothetical protein